MAAKLKVTRKELLKKPDEFLSFTRNTINYFQNNKKLGLGILAAVTFLAITYVVVFFWRDSQRQQVLQLEQEGIRFLSSFAAGSQAENKPVDDVKKAIDKFQEIIRNYSGAERALVYLADCYFQLKQFDDAEKNYLQYLGEKPRDGLFTIAANRSLGYVYEAKRDYDKAIRYFLAASNDLPEEKKLRTFIDVARCYEEMKKPDLAVEYYQKVVQNADKGRAPQDLRSRGGRYDVDRIKGKIAQLQSQPE